MDVRQPRTITLLNRAPAARRVSTPMVREAGRSSDLGKAPRHGFDRSMDDGCAGHAIEFYE